MILDFRNSFSCIYYVLKNSFFVDFIKIVPIVCLQALGSYNDQNIGYIQIDVWTAFLGSWDLITHRLYPMKY